MRGTYTMGGLATTMVPLQRRHQVLQTSSGEVSTLMYVGGRTHLGPLQIIVN